MFECFKSKTVRQDGVGSHPDAAEKIPAKEIDVNSKDWTKRALEIVGWFETGGRGWGTVAGNFDTAGISHGMLQWNIKYNSAQPLVIKFGKREGIDAILDLMPEYGIRYLDNIIMDTNISKATAYAAKLAPSYNVPLGLRRELNALWSHPTMIEIQIEAAEDIAGRARRQSLTWSTQFQEPEDFTVFLVYFDLYVNNGGPKSIEPKLNPQPLTQIARWLRLQGGVQANMSTLNSNIIINGREEISDTQHRLLDLCQRRHMSSISKYRGLTLSRKVICILGHGHLNQTYVDFRDKYPAKTFYSMSDNVLI